MAKQSEADELAKGMVAETPEAAEAAEDEEELLAEVVEVPAKLLVVEAALLVQTVEATLAALALSKATLNVDEEAADAVVEPASGTAAEFQLLLLLGDSHPQDRNIAARAQ